jgi:uncharacterized protein YlxW (UPF0749 family)
MKKENAILAFVLTGLVMGMLMTWHFRTRLPVADDFPSHEVKAREELLKEFLEEQSYLQSRIVALRQQIEETQQNIQIHSSESNLELLEWLKEEIGLVEVVGAGVEITLDDSKLVSRINAEEANKGLVKASDLRDIINILNSSNADAVSINGQRVIASSPITSVGTTILINNSHVAPPFSITVVGDTEVLLRGVLDKNLLGDLYERKASKSLIFDIVARNRLVVPVYNGDLKTDHINLIE